MRRKAQLLVVSAVERSKGMCVHASRFVTQTQSRRNSIVQPTYDESYA